MGFALLDLDVSASLSSFGLLDRNLGLGVVGLGLSFHCLMMSLSFLNV